MSPGHERPLALVTGATGFTGGYLARELRRRGYRVRALVRPGSNAQGLRADGIEVVEGQLVRRTYDPVRRSWDGAGAERETNAVGGERNADRYPAYHRFDLAVSRSYVKPRVTITPFLQVVNAYNRRNVWIYRFDYEESPPTSEAISQFPILPTIGVTVEW